MSDAAISLLILAAVVVLFVWNRLPVEVVAIGSALALYFTGVLDLPDVLIGFGDPAVILIAALFVVSEGLELSGVTAWAGQALTRLAGTSTKKLLIYTMLLSGFLTALIGLNGAVASLLPMAVVTAMRLGLSPSRLLMPLAFAGSAGGVLLLIGSPVNVVISDAAEAAGVGAIGLFEFTLVGVPLLAGTILLISLLGPKLIPDRLGTAQRNLSDHAATLVQHYSLNKVFHLRAGARSPMLGLDRASCAKWGNDRATVITVTDGETGTPSIEGPLTVNDRVTAIGDTTEIQALAVDKGFTVEAVRGGDEVRSSLLTKEVGVVEVVVPPRSKLVDRGVHPGSILDNSLVVLAVHRAGHDLGAGDIDLRVGDVLLLEGPWPALDAIAADNDVLVVDSPDLLRRQAVPRGTGSTRALVVLIAMVLLLASGIVPPVIAALLAAGAMIVMRVVAPYDAYRRVSWSTVLLVAGMFPMSAAITQSGAGEMIAEAVLQVVGDAGPTALLAGLALITMIFSQLISNTATALVMIPIGISAATQLDISAKPVLLSLAVAAAASFLTPVATPANLMVLGPAGYRFGDYWKMGLPLIVFFFVVAVFLVPVIWSF